MNDVQKETAAVADTTKRVYETLISTLSGVGATWATYGLKVGKMALVSSADTLGKTARLLDTLATELEKKSAAAQTRETVLRRRGSGCDRDARRRGRAGELRRPRRDHAPTPSWARVVCVTAALQSGRRHGERRIADDCAAPDDAGPGR